MPIPHQNFPVIHGARNTLPTEAVINSFGGTFTHSPYAFDVLSGRTYEGGRICDHHGCATQPGIIHSHALGLENTSANAKIASFPDAVKAEFVKLAEDCFYKGKSSLDFNFLIRYVKEHCSSTLKLVLAENTRQTHFLAEACRMSLFYYEDLMRDCLGHVETNFDPVEYLKHLTKSEPSEMTELLQLLLEKPDATREWWRNCVEHLKLGKLGSVRCSTTPPCEVTFRADVELYTARLQSVVDAMIVILRERPTTFAGLDSAFSKAVEQCFPPALAISCRCFDKLKPGLTLGLQFFLRAEKTGEANQGIVNEDAVFPPVTYPNKNWFQLFVTQLKSHRERNAIWQQRQRHVENVRNTPITNAMPSIFNLIV